MTTINASWDTLTDQASSTVEGYFFQAIQIIDRQFGDGYAAKNPELVGSLVSSMAADFQTAGFAVAVGEIADRLLDIATNLESGG